VTILDYLRQSGACNTRELMELKRDHPADFDVIKEWAKEEMTHKGVEVT
jgi:actin-related protein